MHNFIYALYEWSSTRRRKPHYMSLFWRSISRNQTFEYMYDQGQPWHENRRKNAAAEWYEDEE